MPPLAVYDTLQQLLRELVLDLTYEQFCETYSWLHIPKDDWNHLLQNMSYWANPETMYQPKLDSTQ
jgi:hypothetical protein